MVNIFTEEISISCDAERIFDYVTDPNKWHEWYPSSQPASEKYEAQKIGTQFQIVTVQQHMQQSAKNFTPINFTRLSFILCVVFLMACSSVQDEPAPLEEPLFSVRYDESFSRRPNIISVQELHQLSFQQQQHFLTYFHDKKRRNIAAHERIADYMENLVDNFVYESATYTAEQTFRRSRGNCLSLAILTTALANLVNIEVGYQLADSIPIFSSSDSVIFKGVHIRSMLYDPNFIPEEGRYYLRRPGLRIDYFPSGAERFVRNVSGNDYVARYYLNLAATAIREKNYSHAYWLTIESLDFAPLNSDAFNSLGVIYRRTGNTAKAEEIYRYGVEHLADKLSLLKNYRILLGLQNRDYEAKLITDQIERLDDPSPFSFIHAAQESYDEGQFVEAIKFYRRALTMAPYLHEARLALAQSYYQAGKLSDAKTQLKAAIKSAQKLKTRTLYEAKLLSLTEKID